MHRGLRIGAVIPARDEEASVGAVVTSLRDLCADDGSPVLDDVVVCDNGSSDGTAEMARRAGARVVPESVPGYGRACLAALAALRPVDVVLFVDADQAFDVRQSFRLLDAVADGADLAIGSRALGRVEPGALSIPQVVGNRVASILICALWRRRVTDLGPFRAVRTEALGRLSMADMAYGWTVEMQVKAIQAQLVTVERPVDTRRRRSGRSKVGGTLRGVAGASVGILGMILRLWLHPVRQQR